MRRWMGLVLWAGCAGGEPTDEDRVDAILELEGDTDAGGEVFAASCASCHGDDGSGLAGATQLSGSDLRGLDRVQVVTTIVTPPSGMLTFDTVPDQDLADVAAFVTGL
jgi:mono/diheme cytochrome c family protein